MPNNSNDKRERQYDELVEEFHHENRYEGREKEVAARIVNKQRAQQSETLDEKSKDKSGQSPDRDLPVEGYDHLTVDEIVGKLDDLNSKEIKQIERYEKQHRDRKTLLEAIERRRN